MLIIWVIYGQPSDFPDHFVIRRQCVRDGRITIDAIGGLYGSLDEARADIPDGLAYLPRFDSDDPVIVETWI